MIYLAAIVIAVGVIMLLYAWRKSVERPGSPSRASIRHLRRQFYPYRQAAPPLARPPIARRERDPQAPRQAPRYIQTRARAAPQEGDPPSPHLAAGRFPQEQFPESQFPQRQFSQGRFPERRFSERGQSEGEPAAREGDRRVIQGRQLRARGILYMDQERRFPYTARNWSEIPASQYSELRRIGEGTITVGRRRFVLHSGEVSYSYSTHDLDQILFKSSGLALVPLRFDRPVPLFLTKEADRVKGFIKRHATVRSQ